MNRRGNVRAKRAAMVAFLVAGATDGTSTVCPRTCTYWGTSSASTTAGRYTPNGVAPDGPPESP